MHNEDLINLSKARIKHAKDCLKESDILLSAGEYKGAANRACYAVFHSMRAMLILDEFDSKKNSGIKEYIVNDIIDVMRERDVKI